MIKETINKAKHLFSLESYIQKLVFEELEIKEKDFGNSDFLESINDLLYVLYTLDNKDICLEFYQYFEKTKPVEDKRVWIWLESSLLLFSVVFAEKGDNKKYQECLRKVKEAFKLGNDLVLSVNEKARNRKMNGDLLPYAHIDKSLKENDKEDELTYRLTYLKGLIYIKGLGYSKAMPINKVNNEINSNVKELRKLV